MACPSDARQFLTFAAPLPASTWAGHRLARRGPFSLLSFQL